MLSRYGHHRNEVVRNEVVDNAVAIAALTVAPRRTPSYPVDAVLTLRQFERIADEDAER